MTTTAISDPKAKRSILDYVDPTVYPSMIVHGKKIEKIARIPCTCGDTVDLLQERVVATPENRRGIEPKQGGFRVLWSSPSECNTCLVQREILSKGLTYRALDRGVHRSAIDETIGWRRSLQTMMGGLEAEILASIAAAVSGDWIPTATLMDHPHAAAIAPLVANLTGDPTPPTSAFRLGGVDIQRDPYLVLTDREVCGYLDRHARRDHGEVGMADPSPATTWSLSLATPAELNGLAVAVGQGPVRSRYVRPELTNGHPVLVDVITILRHSGSRTTVSFEIGF